MSDFTWKEWLPIISLVISLLALFVNLSKFITDMVDRKERKKKEKAETEAKLKSKFKVSSSGNVLTIENDSNVDVFIKEILFDGIKWEESGLSCDARPLEFTYEQKKNYRLTATKENPFPTVVTIKYSDPYTRKHGSGVESKDYHL